MKTLLLAAALSLLGFGKSLAGEAAPSPGPQPGAEAPPACDPAAYVAGVDATGRAVAPADLSPQGTLSAGTVVVPKIRTPNNPNVRNVEIGVELEGLTGTLSSQPCAGQAQPQRQ